MEPCTLSQSEEEIHDYRLPNMGTGQQLIRRCSVLADDSTSRRILANISCCNVHFDILLCSKISRG